MTLQITILNLCLSSFYGSWSFGNKSSGHTSDSSSCHTPIGPTPYACQRIRTIFCGSPIRHRRTPLARLSGCLFGISNPCVAHLPSPSLPTLFTKAQREALAKESAARGNAPRSETELKQTEKKSKMLKTSGFNRCSVGCWSPCGQTNE